MTSETEEKQEELESSGACCSLLAGMGLGVMIGAALALLWAPQSGSETQAELKEVAAKLKERTEELLDQAKESGQRFVQRQESEIKQVLEVGQQAAAEKKKELEKELGIS